MNLKEESLKLHEENHGKLEVKSKVRIENKNYYLQIDGDSNVFTFPPSDDFSFEYKNIHYTIYK